MRHLHSEPLTTIQSDTDHRFRRTSRLNDKRSFSYVFEGAKRSRDKMFTVLYRKNTICEARLGLAIGKKNCRLSVARNRIKRIVRESFRQHRTNLSGLDIVVLNQPAATKAGNKELFQSLANHWQHCCNEFADVLTDAASGTGKSMENK